LVELRKPVALIATPGVPVNPVLLVKSAWRDAKLTEARLDFVEALCRDVPGFAGFPDVPGVTELKETPGWLRVVVLPRNGDADVENDAVPKFERGGEVAENVVV